MGVHQGSERVTIRRPTGDVDPMASLPEDARSGLSGTPKRLRSKYHYDARGSELFEQITALPEYYPTRTEEGILKRVADDVVSEVMPRALVEYGSGSASKTRVLLDAMERLGILEGYGAVEVSEAALLGSATTLFERYPDLRFEGVLADFESEVELPFAEPPRLILFLGSTIGNLTHAESSVFLRGVRSRMNQHDGFLIGFDLLKDVARIEAAYNDSAGVTAQFSLNILNVLNRELEGDFRLEDFRHEAVFNEAEGRIEAYLVAQRPVQARLVAIDLEVTFEEGERLCTELSHKYTRESATGLLESARLDLVRWESDPENLFAVALTRP